MNPKTITSARLVLMLISVIWLFPASGFAGSWAEAVKDEIFNRAGVQYLTGWVDCGAEVEGAEIRIYNTDGQLLNLTPPVQSAPVLAGASGVFSVAVANLPNRFRIKAINGLCQGEQVNEVEGTYWNVQPEQDVVHVNLVTTLLARYIDRYPGIDYEEAQATVKHYLQIPDDIELGRGPDIGAADFSLKRFWSDAVVSGGVEPLMEQLVAELESDPSAIYQPRAVGVESLEEGISYVLEKSFSGIIGGVASKGFGYFLTRIGFIGAEQKAILGEINKVKETLKEIKQMITDVNSSVKKAENVILAELAQTNYDSQMALLRPLLGQIQRYTVDLATLAVERVDGSATSETELEEKTSKLLKEIEQNILGVDGFYAMDRLNTALVNMGGSRGLIQVWSEAVSRRKHFLNPSDSDLMRKQFNYFDGYQLCVLALSAEYYFAVKSEDTVNVWVEQLIAEYKANNKAQEQILPKQIPNGTIVETGTGLMLAPYATTGAAFETSYGIDFVRNSNYAGFKPWRLPTTAEARKMFELVNSNRATWAVAPDVGYPTGTWLNDTSRLLVQDGGYNGRTYTLSMKTGNFTLNVCKQFGGHHGVGWEFCLPGVSQHADFRKFGQVLPVRTPLASERYYYK